MRKYLTFSGIAVKDALFHRGKILSSLFVWGLRAVVVCVLYSYAYGYIGHDVKGISREVALWSMAVYFVYLALGYRMVYYDVTREIKQGDVEIRLNKPYSYPMFLIVSRLSKNLPEFALTAFGIVLFLVWYAPLRDFAVTFTWIFATVLLSFGGLVLGSAFYFFIGLFAFWLEEADPVYWLCDKLVMIFGGSYVPVALFPDTLRSIAQYSPFGSMIFISHVFYPDFLTLWPRLFAIQWIWALIFSVGAYLLYRHIRRQVFVNGG